MGTRADFYVGRGESAEWLGSIAWDGYPSGIAGSKHSTSKGDIKACPILNATTEKAFRRVVSAELARRDDGTAPNMGWPWPWETSATTDFAYAFDQGKVYASCFGGKWYRATSPRLHEESSRGEVAVFPNMKERANVQFGGKRSGLIVVSTRGVT